MPGKPNAIYLIVNPTSGRGAGARSLPSLRRYLDERYAGTEYRIDLTESTDNSAHWRSSAFALAQTAASQGLDRIIAVGGDGTLHEVANGIIGSDATLGVIPMGTGNDFVRTAGISGSIEQCLRGALEWPGRMIDVGKTGDRYFLNVAGSGFDAAVAKRINDGIRLLKGTSAYIAAVLRTLADYKAVELTISSDTETRTVKAMLCAIANAKYYGGGMMIAPSAQIDDGLFEVTVIEEIGRMGFLRAFPGVFKGAHIHHPKYSDMKGTRVRIESERPVPILVDGELMGTTPVEFEIVPKALRIALPPLNESDTISP